MTPYGFYAGEPQARHISLASALHRANEVGGRCQVALEHALPGRRVANNAREEASMIWDARSCVVVLSSALLLFTAGCARHKTPGTTTTTLPSSTGTPVVLTSPAPSAAVAGTGAVHHLINGEVTDVDRNSGKVNIRASDGSKVQVILPPLAVATTNKGDRASLDVTIAPAR
jgi:hypothetical protein